VETIVYRKIDASPWMQELHTGEGASSTHTAAMLDSVRGTGPLPVDLLFPVVTAEEMVTWTHWLPTCMVFDCASLQSPAAIIDSLTQLKAPPEVLETFHWSWKFDLFEAYEVRTPVRNDVRDPLLLGRVGEQYYRLALWGESLLPLEQMTALVQQSLALRTRVEKRKGWVALGGTLLGLAVGLLWAWGSPEAEPVGISLLFTFVGFFLAWLPTFLYTPENRQHDFLDRYRC
jgi:hypothetical protein